MRTFFTLAGLVLALCGSGLAQAGGIASCPAISVSGPSGILSPGEDAGFSAQIDWKGDVSKIEYFWSVSAGSIVRGQGTNTIAVKNSDPELTAVLTIKGLPTYCSDTAGATYSTCMGHPTAEQLDEISGPLEKISDARFKAAIEAAKAYPNTQLFISVSASKHAPAESLRLKRQILIKKIGEGFDDLSHMTVVESTDNDDLTVIWLVPPGASNPVVNNK